MNGLENVNLEFVDTIDKAFALKSWLGERRPSQVLGFDTETRGLDTFGDSAGLRMVQIGDDQTGWAIPWERWGGVAIEALDAWEGRWTAHNLSFDYKVMKRLANYTLPWDRFDDTMLMAQIDAPGGRAGLKDLTDKFIDPRASQGQIALKEAFKNNGWDWATVPLNYPDFWIYSALDPVLAAQLHTHYKHIPENYSRVYDLEYSVRKICTEMEYTGMKIDVDYVATTHEELGKKIEEGKKWAEETWGINIASGPQLVEFFSKLNGKFSHFTAKGAPSVNKEQLDLFAEDEDEYISSAAKFVLDIRKTEKVNSAYFENFLNMHNDGVLHPEIKTLAARTGRMSITNPALQTLPSGEDRVRKAFVPRHEDQILVSCDYSQMELRLLAHYSEDPALIEAFRKADEEDGDFFNEIGKLVFHAENFDRHTPEFKKQGKNVKTLMYGMIYGASVKKLSEQSKVPLDEMQEAYDGLTNSFPGIKDFMDTTISLAEQRLLSEGVGYALLDSGRVLPADKDKLYAATNFKLQGTGAEITKRALLRLDASGLTPYMQVPIHDEIIFTLPKDEIDYWMPIIRDCMSFVSGEFRVPMPAEPEILGSRWGDGAKYA